MKKGDPYPGPWKMYSVALSRDTSFENSRPLSMSSVWVGIEIILVSQSPLLPRNIHQIIFSDKRGVQTLVTTASLAKLSTVSHVPECCIVSFVSSRISNPKMSLEVKSSSANSSGSGGQSHFLFDVFELEGLLIFSAPHRSHLELFAKRNFWAKNFCHSQG